MQRLGWPNTLPGLKTLGAMARELRGAKRVARDGRSFARLAIDIVLYRALKLGGFGMRNRERTIRLQNGVTLTYRLNRGDIQSIREVWLDNVYRLPFDLTVSRVVDLGANIGLTSVYFAKTYGAQTILAVEPNPANAELARRNFEQNGISARVIEAAIGPVDGFARFSDTLDSNLGAVSEAGREVRMISMSTLCAESPRMGPIDLLKMDIEGGEQALLSGSIEWLGEVRAIIAEFHPDIVDYPGLAERISGAGFRWYKVGAVYERTTDAFIRVAEAVA